MTIAILIVTHLAAFAVGVAATFSLLKFLSQ